MNVLELSISPTGTPGRYLAHITHSPAGEASAVLTIDADSLISRDELQRAVLASATATRTITRTIERPLRTTGESLFAAIFSAPALAGRYRGSLAICEKHGERLRIVLRLDAPELAALPWEAMYDVESGRYLCRREPLVRTLSAPTATQPLQVRPPLRILGIAASPRGLPALDVDKEKHSMSVALQHLTETGAITMQWVRSGTWPAIQDTLLGAPWHVIHFVGHGDFDTERGEGVLSLEGENGRPHHVEASRFVDLLSEASPTPRLVVLNACSSATEGTDDLFSGTASALSRSGISAVVAMQFAVSDNAAIDFCRGFYSALAHGKGVDEALRSGRIAILGRNAGTLEWLTPVLYLRGPDARIFAVDEPSGEVGDAAARPADRARTGPGPPVESRPHAEKRPITGTPQASSREPQSTAPAVTDSGAPAPRRRADPAGPWWGEVHFARRSGLGFVDSTLVLYLDRTVEVVARGRKDALEIDGVVKVSRWWRLRGRYTFEIEDAAGTRSLAFDVAGTLWGEPWGGIYRFKDVTVDGVPIDVQEDDPPT